MNFNFIPYLRSFVQQFIHTHIHSVHTMTSSSPDLQDKWASGWKLRNVQYSLEQNIDDRCPRWILDNPSQVMFSWPKTPCHKFTTMNSMGNLSGINPLVPYPEYKMSPVQFAKWHFSEVCVIYIFQRLRCPSTILPSQCVDAASKHCRLLLALFCHFESSMRKICVVTNLWPWNFESYWQTLWKLSHQIKSNNLIRLLIQGSFQSPF